MIFFFKQKTAYELLRSLVGSEMCIRDSAWGSAPYSWGEFTNTLTVGDVFINAPPNSRVPVCLLYTSDAADDLLCVDLGGRRIITKTKQGRKQWQTPIPLTSISLILPQLTDIASVSLL